VVNYDVVIDIGSPCAGLLRPEMTASVTVQLEGREGVLAVPAGAVRRERGGNVVRVVSPSGIRTREVAIGLRDGGWVEVVSGLSEGETVLIEDAGGSR
jgi:multidrug efflux pump subunit AcrA (membrane-fusion protein)